MRWPSKRGGLFRLLGALMLGACLDQACSFTGKLGIMVRLHGLDGNFMGVSRQRVAAAAVLAVNHINRRESFMIPDAHKLHPNFTIAYEMEDTFSDPSTGVQLGIDFGTKGVHYIIGASRSAVSAPVSLVASTNSIPVISYASTAPELSEKSTHPLFSRTISGDDTTALAITVSCFGLGWRNIAVMYTDDTYGRGYAEALASSASLVGLKILSSNKYKAGDTAGIQLAVNSLWNSGARIIVLVAYTSDVTKIVEAAVASGIAGGGYVWLVSDSVSDPETVLQQSENPDLVNHLVGFNQVKATPLFGERGERFREMWAAVDVADVANELFDVAPIAEELLAPCSELCALMYDAVWAAAFAINGVADHEGQGLDREALAPQMLALNFSGASGTVAFHPQTGDRFPGSVPLTVTNWQPRAAADGSTYLEAVDFMVWDHLNGLQRVPLASPPWWPGQRQGWEVPLDGSTCGGGTVLSDVTLECEPCQQGAARDGDDPSNVCSLCPQGKFAPFRGMSQCIPCTEDGYAPGEGHAECVPCPANTQRRGGSAGLNVSECKCLPGFFYAGDADRSCRMCVVGGVCPGGDDAPFPQAQYWGDKECKEYGGSEECASPYMFVECNPAEFCNADFACKEGREGRQCLVPSKGWFVLGKRFFLQCGDDGKITSSFMILVVFLIWFGMNKVASGNYDALDIGLLFVQITGMIASYGLKWHSNLSWLKIGLDVANFDVDFVAPNCLMDWTEVHSFYLQLFLPFFFGLCYLVYFVFELTVLAKWSWTRKGRESLTMETVWGDWTKSCLSFLLVVYHTLCLKCFQTFSCDVYPSGKSFISLAPEIECWTTQHWVMLSISAIYILVVIVAVPAWVFYRVVHHTKNNTLNDRIPLRTWGFIHRRYENDYKYWEAMLLLRRLSIALVSVCIKTSMVQAAVSIIILTILLASHVYTRPYIAVSVDALDFVSICGSMIYVLAGMLMYPSITARSQGMVCTEDSSTDVCNWDLEIKRATSILTLVASLITIAISMVISADFIRETHRQAKASALVQKLVTGGSELGDVEETANKVSLDAALRGGKVLKWAEGLLDAGQGEEGTGHGRGSPLAGPLHSESSAALPRFSGPREAAAFMEVERGLRQLEVDVTDNSSRPLARVLRSLTALPGVIDWLTLCSEDERQTVLPIVEDLAHFIEEAEGKHGGESLSVTEMVRQEHRPMIILFLISCTGMQRRSFVVLMEGLLRDNEAPSNSWFSERKEADRGHRTSSIRKWTPVPLRQHAAHQSLMLRLDANEEAARQASPHASSKRLRPRPPAPVWMEGVEGGAGEAESAGGSREGPVPEDWMAEAEERQRKREAPPREAAAPAQSDRVDDPAPRQPSPILCAELASHPAVPAMHNGNGNGVHQEVNGDGARAKRRDARREKERGDDEGRHPPREVTNGVRTRVFGVDEMLYWGMEDDERATSEVVVAVLGPEARGGREGRAMPKTVGYSHGPVLSDEETPRAGSGTSAQESEASDGPLMC